MEERTITSFSVCRQYTQERDTPLFFSSSLFSVYSYTQIFWEQDNIIIIIIIGYSPLFLGRFFFIFLPFCGLYVG
jgi:hypothetical protein